MARPKVTNYATGQLNEKAVGFELVSGRLVMFHNMKAWDNAADVQSKHGKYFATDLGECSVMTTDNVTALIKAWGLVGDDFTLQCDFDQVEQTTATTQATTQVQTTAQAAAMPSGDAIANAMMPIFAGVTQQVTAQVMAQLQPIINAAPVRHEHIIKINDKPEKKIEGEVAPEFETILKLVAMSKAVYMYGPAGCGKNVIAGQVADALGLKFRFANSVQDILDIVGYTDANGNYHGTEFSRALEGGDLFFLDELDASVPEVLVQLNSLLANGYTVLNGQQVHANTNFRVIAAGNTKGHGADTQYNGRYQLDAASLNRFIPVPVKYAPNVEREIANNDKEMLSFFYELREIAKNKHFDVVLGYRNLKNLFDLSQAFTLAESIQMAITNGMDDDAARMLLASLKYNDNRFNHAAKEIKIA